jgi:ADP-ribosylglycohydrolase
MCISSIAGDMIGSCYEFHNIDTEEFDFFSKKSTFTDDTVLTIATMDVILDKKDYAQYYLDYAQAYPNRGYGNAFLMMVLMKKLVPYNSYGNGSAMRISPVGWVFETLDETIAEAKRSAECTHNHEEGIKGAVAIAGSIFIARKGGTKEDIKKFVENVGYDLSKKLSDFEQGKFDVTCQGTIPICIAILMETDSFEQAIRKAVAMGGDVDTNACIVGGVCDALYGLPSDDIVENVYRRLPEHMRKITTAFVTKYVNKNFKPPVIPLSEESELFTI